MATSAKVAGWLFRAVAVVSLSSACYTYAAVAPSESLAQERVEFTLSDHGRVALLPSVGPGVLTVDGRVLQATEADWTVAVFRINTIASGPMIWSGETVVLPRTAVSLASRRRLDRRASIYAAAGVAGGIAFFVLTRSLLGGGFTPGDGDVPPVTAFRP